MLAPTYESTWRHNPEELQHHHCGESFGFTNLVTTVLQPRLETRTSWIGRGTEPKVFVNMFGVKWCLWTVASNGPVVHLQVIYENGAPVEWYQQGKTGEFSGNTVPVPLCLPHIPRGLNRAHTTASAMKAATNRLSHSQTEPKVVNSATGRSGFCS
jgi:hypothetical protein